MPSRFPGDFQAARTIARHHQFEADRVFWCGGGVRSGGGGGCAAASERDRIRAGVTVGGGGRAARPGAERDGDVVVGGEELLRVTRRLEPTEQLLASARVPVRGLRAVVQPLVPAVLETGGEPADRSGVAARRVADDRPRPAPHRRRRRRATARGSGRRSRSRPLETPLGVLPQPAPADQRSELAREAGRPGADRPAEDDDAALGQESLDAAQAEAQAQTGPHGGRDDPAREATTPKAPCRRRAVHRHQPRTTSHQPDRGLRDRRGAPGQLVDGVAWLSSFPGVLSLP